MSRQEWVKGKIIEEIQRGVYVKGQRLPSCRSLSNQLKVNKITVNKAYESLERDHVVYSVPRGGYYLIGLSDKPAIEKKSIDYRIVKPEKSQVPFRAFSHCMTKAIDRYQSILFNETPVAGLHSLREVLVAYLSKDSVYTKAEQIIVTQGAQQGIDMIFQYIKHKGGQLLIESPSYSLAIKRLELLNIPTKTISRTKEGIDLIELEALFKQGEIASFYLMSRYHNPTGYSLSECQKKKIVSLCQTYNVWLIEDDYLGDLGAVEEGAPCHYYDMNDKVIYLRSFSKTFMPGIRLGLMVCPKGLTEDLIQFKKSMDLSSSLLNQGALELYISTGMYDKHVDKIKKDYNDKIKIATQICSNLNQAIKVDVPKSGIFIWITWPSTMDVSNHIETLRANGIYITTAENHYLQPSETSHTRLCLLSIPKDKLYTLAEVIKVC